MTSKSLAAAAIGDRCLLLDIRSDSPEIQSRLLSLGLIPGSTIQVMRIAPLGDPMQVKVGGSTLSIRKADADVISVEVQ